MSTEEIPEYPEMITISLAAEILGMSRQSVHKMTRTSPPRLKAWRLRSAGNDRPLIVREKDVLAMKDLGAQVLLDPTSQE